MPALNLLYNDYRARAAFFIVYIQEAHPVDAWQQQDNIDDDVLVASTTTEADRAETAGLCLTKLAIKLPALVDGADDRVERAYTGWPDRLYVIDTDGRVAFKSAAGPFGFKPAAMKAALDAVLAHKPRPS